MLCTKTKRQAARHAARYSAPLAPTLDTEHARGRHVEPSTGAEHPTAAPPASRRTRHTASAYHAGPGLLRLLLRLACRQPARTTHMPHMPPRSPCAREAKLKIVYGAYRKRERPANKQKEGLACSYVTPGNSNRRDPLLKQWFLLGFIYKGIFGGSCGT